MMRRSIHLAAFFAAAVLVAGCGSRRHMSRGYGRSVEQAFAAQVIRKQPPAPGALPAGLDPDDARLINENYRVTMARKGAEKKSSGIIIVNEEEVRRAGRKEKD